MKRAILIAVILLGYQHTSVHTQTTERIISPSHGSISLIRSLQARGLIRGSVDLGRRTFTLTEVDSLLHTAINGELTAEERTHLLARIGVFHKQHNIMHSAPQKIGANVRMGVATETDTYKTGLYSQEQKKWIPSEKENGSTRGIAEATLRLAPLKRTLIEGTIKQDGANTELQALYGITSTKSWLLWAGKRDVYVGNRSYSAIIQNQNNVYGFGFSRTRPYHGRGVLGYLGDVKMESYLTKTDANGKFQSPYLWGARITLTPNDKTVIGFNRLIQFGGEGNEPITPKNILLTLAGFTSYYGKDTAFENSLASADLTWVGKIKETPIVFTTEWGFEDAGWSWINVPGISSRIELPELPSTKDISANVTFTWMNDACCGYPPWYRHKAFSEGWTEGGAPIGHELGGNGTELRAELSKLDLDNAREYSLSLTSRNRKSENLYSPTLEGRSLATTFQIQQILESGLVVTARGYGEIWKKSDKQGRLEVQVSKTF